MRTVINKLTACFDSADGSYSAEVGMDMDFQTVHISDGNRTIFIPAAEWPEFDALVRKVIALAAPQRSPHARRAQYTRRGEGVRILRNMLISP